MTVLRLTIEACFLKCNQKKRKLNLRAIYFCLAIVYITFVPYHWLDSEATYFFVNIMLLVYASVISIAENLLVRLVYMVREEERWTIKASQAIGGIISALFPLNSYF